MFLLMPTQPPQDDSWAGAVDMSTALPPQHCAHMSSVPVLGNIDVDHRCHTWSRQMRQHGHKRAGRRGQGRNWTEGGVKMQKTRSRVAPPCPRRDQGHMSLIRLCLMRASHPFYSVFYLNISSVQKYKTIRCSLCFRDTFPRFN